MIHFVHVHYTHECNSHALSQSLLMRCYDCIREGEKYQPKWRSNLGGVSLCVITLSLKRCMNRFFILPSSGAFELRSLKTPI